MMSTTSNENDNMMTNNNNQNDNDNNNGGPHYKDQVGIGIRSAYRNKPNYKEFGGVAEFVVNRNVNVVVDDDQQTKPTSVCIPIIPEQQREYPDDDDNPPTVVIAKAYKVNSFITIEAQPIIRIIDSNIMNQSYDEKCGTSGLNFISVCFPRRNLK